MLAQHLPALRRRSQRPVDRPHRALRIREAHRVDLVLLIQLHIADMLELVRLLHRLQPSAHLLQLLRRLEVRTLRRVLAFLREQVCERLRHFLIPQPLLHLVEEAKVVIQLRP